MDKEKKKVEELEESLAHEEDVLEEIRDSLKGECSTHLVIHSHQLCAQIRHRSSMTRSRSSRRSSSLGWQRSTLSKQRLT